MSATIQDNATGLTSRVVIARNAAAMLASDVGIRALSAVGVVLVARSLGPRAYGILSVALAFAAIAAYFSDLGLTHLTIQYGTRPGADLGRMLGTILKVRILLVAGVALFSLGVILRFYSHPEQRAVMLSVVLPGICGTAMQGFASSYFWANQELHIMAAIKTGNQLFAAAGLLAAFLFRWPVRGVAAVYGSTALAGGLACLWLLGKRAPRMYGWNPAVLKGLTAFTIGGVTGSALPQIGPLIMERVATAVEVGYYAAASRIPSFLCAIPGALGIAWYPQLFRAAARDARQHLTLCTDQLKVNLVLSCGLSLPLALNARPVIRAVLGPAWEAATGAVLAILCWMVVLNSLCIAFGDALTTAGLQARRACVYVAALAIGCGLFLALASRRGALGGAAAAVTTQVLLIAGLVMANPRGNALLKAAARRSFRPIFLAGSCCVLLHIVLGDGLFSCAAGIGTFFLVAMTSDAEMRASALRCLAELSSKRKCECKAA
jgi:O-antigen/teichoic acid export membrane protein